MNADRLQVPASITRVLAASGITLVVPADITPERTKAATEALDRLDRQARAGAWAARILFPGGVDAPDLVEAAAALSDTLRALRLDDDELPVRIRPASSDLYELPDEIADALSELVEAVDDNRSADARGEVEATILDALRAAREAGALDRQVVLRAGHAELTQIPVPAGWDIDLASWLYTVTTPDAETAAALCETLCCEGFGASNIDHEPRVLVWFDGDDGSDRETRAVLARAVEGFIGASTGARS
jgi:hypothetical protein